MITTCFCELLFFIFINKINILKTIFKNDYPLAFVDDEIDCMTNLRAIRRLHFVISSLAIQILT